LPAIRRPFRRYIARLPFRYEEVKSVLVVLFAARLHRSFTINNLSTIDACGTWPRPIPAKVFLYYP